MLQIEKEMIGLLMKGASTPMENIQVSFFLVAWSALLLAVLRMVQHGEEKQGFTQAEGIQELARDFAKKTGAETQTKARPPVRRKVNSK